MKRSAPYWESRGYAAVDRPVTNVDLAVHPRQLRRYSGFDRDEGIFPQRLVYRTGFLDECTCQVTLSCGHVRLVTKEWFHAHLTGFVTCEMAHNVHVYGRDNRIMVTAVGQDARP